MTEQQGHWRTITEAATELGRSERTIRRWLESGRVDVDRTKTPLRVNIADELRTVAETKPDLDRLQADIARLEAVLEQVISERDHLRQALDMSQTLLDQQQRLTTTLTGQRLISAPGQRRWWQFWKDAGG